MEYNILIKKINKTILPYGFAIFVLAICLLIFVFENINGRFWLNDFKVYYLASKSLIVGTQIYGTPFGLDSGLYKYSPFVLLLFMPFTLFPFKIACIIYFFGIVFFVLWIFTLLKKLTQTYFFSKPARHEAWILTAVFIFILNLFFRELHLGNTNILLLLLLLLSVKHLVHSKYFIAGILFGLVILFKPFFLILVLPILLHKKWKIISGAIFFIVIQLIIFLIFFGWNTTYFLHTEWVKTMLDHSSSFPSNNNIDHLVRHYISSGVPASFQYIILVGVCLLYLGLFWYNNYFRSKKIIGIDRSNSNFIFECFILIAVLPSILNTDTEHFLYSLPIITTIAYYIFQQKNIFLIFCFILLFMLFGLNSNDIVGKYIADFYDQIGALGISNLFLIIFLIFVYFKGIKKNLAVNC